MSQSIPAARRILGALAAGLVAASTLTIATLAVSTPAFADEAEIRKNIVARVPDFPKIDEVTKTPMPGLWEVRVGMDVYYTDEHGDYFIQGRVIDTRSHANLTQQRLDKLSAIDFDTLPLKDAMLIKQGSGTRKLAVFVDPNCGYCKRFERDLAAAKDVSVYVFLYPVLGPDSEVKSRDIWCSKNGQATWRAWMLDGRTPPKTMGNCDSAALERNVAFGQKYRINGTPALLFEDGRRVPGAIQLDQLEKQLAEASSAAKTKPKS